MLCAKGRVSRLPDEFGYPDIRSSAHPAAVSTIQISIAPVSRDPPGCFWLNFIASSENRGGALWRTDQRRGMGIKLEYR